jgi:hypothetical protein
MKGGSPKGIYSTSDEDSDPEEESDEDFDENHKDQGSEDDEPNYLEEDEIRKANI